MSPTSRIQGAFSTLHHVFVFDTVPAPGGLIGTLRSLLPHIEGDSWDNRLAFGGAYVNGVPARSETELPFPCRLEYYEPKFPISDAPSIYPQFSSDWIVFEDQWLIACFKPAKLPTVPAKEQQHYNLRTYLERHLGTSDLHLPSRLDMSTQGIVIVSKHASMHGPLQQIFEERRVMKRYLFFSHMPPAESPCVVRSPIGKSGTHPVLRAVNGTAPKNAITELRLMGPGKIRTAETECVPGHFIEAIPRTGRTHQIRVHAASIGCPVAGDNFYNGIEAPGLCLLSHALSFEHPFTGAMLDITLPETLVPVWVAPAFQLR